MSEITVPHLLVVVAWAAWMIVFGLKVLTDIWTTVPKN